MNKKTNYLAISVLLGTIFLMNFASAGFAVGFPYKISLHRGETYDGSFQLQNVIPPTEDTTVEIIIEEGEEYMQFPEGKTVNLAAGEIKNIPVKITLPSNADGGDVYKAKIIFKPSSGEAQESGTVSLRFSIGKSFDIEVIGDTKTERLAKTASIILFIVAIVLIIILIIVLKKKKSKK